MLLRILTLTWSLLWMTMTTTTKTMRRLKLVSFLRCLLGGSPRLSWPGFLQYQQQDDEEDEGHPESAAAHARLDRQRFNEAELSNEEMARILKERYSRNDRIVEDMGQVPQRMLMPSVNDPNLWQIKVKVRILFHFRLHGLIYPIRSLEESVTLSSVYTAKHSI
jgi:hypothetical protein